MIEEVKCVGLEPARLRRPRPDTAVDVVISRKKREFRACFLGQRRLSGCFSGFVRAPLLPHEWGHAWWAQVLELLLVHRLEPRCGRGRDLDRHRAVRGDLLVGVVEGLHERAARDELNRRGGR